MILSRRLDTIVNMIKPCNVLADIGCDHGYVSISAIKRGLAQSVISADVAKGPLDAAKRNAAAEGTLDQTDFILSDGLLGFPDASGIECVVIAGMGGILVRKILEQGKLQRFCKLHQLVLGPQSDLDLVRKYLIEELKASIENEKCVYDDGKYYFLMDVALQTENAPYEEFEYHFGKHIDPETIDTYIEYLEHRNRQLHIARESAEKGNAERNASKIAVINESIKYIETALIKAGGSK